MRGLRRGHLQCTHLGHLGLHRLWCRLVRNGRYGWRVLLRRVYSVLSGHVLKPAWQHKLHKLLSGQLQQQPPCNRLHQLSCGHLRQRCSGRRDLVRCVLWVWRWFLYSGFDVCSVRHRVLQQFNSSIRRLHRLRLRCV